MAANSVAGEFCHDSFEGSHDEQCIFNEVFFDNDLSSTSKRCLVTGIINFESDCDKRLDTIVCSNSESSAVSQSFLRNLYQNDLYIENEGGLSASQNFPDIFTSSESDIDVVRAKCQKVSADAISESKARLGDVWPASQPKEVVIDVCSQSKDSVQKTITLHLVESSGQGLTSSCYLLKKDVNMKTCARVDDVLIVEGRLQKSDTGGGKEMVGVAVASPISQKSFASKHVVASPSFCALAKHESSVSAKERISWFESPGQCESYTSLDEELKKDPRLLLQNHIFCLLQEAGWSVEKRKRPSRKYMDTIYRSPEGKLFRDFPTAWKVCGRTLFTNEVHFQEESEGKRWTNFNHFLSDLSEILMNIEKETDHLKISNSLVHRWSLLDPFVTVVFIRKKIGSLRRGDAIEAAGSLVIEETKKKETILTSKIADGTGCLLSQELIPSECYDSSLTAKRLLPILETETSCQTHDDLSVNGSSKNFRCDVDSSTVKCLTGMPIHLVERDWSRISESKTNCLDATSLPTHGSDRTCLQLDSCVQDDLVSACLRLDVFFQDDPNPPEDVDNMLAGSKFVSIPRDSDMGSPSSAKLLEYIAGKHKEAIRDSSSEVQEEESEKFEHLDPSGLANYQQQLLNDHQNLSAHGVVVPRQTEGENEKLIEALNFERESKNSSQVILKKKARLDSKNVPEYKPTDSDHTGIQSSGSPQKHEIEHKCTDNINLDLEEISGSFISKESGEKSTSLSSSVDQIKRRTFKLKRKKPHSDVFDRVQDTTKCQIQDNDLLVSAILRHKFLSFDASKSKLKCQKLRVQSRAKIHKCKLLPQRIHKGSKLYSGLMYNVQSRTVLSWLIVTGAISVNEIIQYRNSEDDTVIKEGLVTFNGVICKCCSNLFSISKFKIHGGFNLNRPCLNLLMASGKPFSLCQLQAWSVEYTTRKSESHLAAPDEHDPNDDSCGLCGDGGELICCDNCPSTFHQTCLSMQELPEGSWYCSNCTCWICGNLADDREASSSLHTVQCLQCEHKYHEVCLKDKSMCEAKVSHPRFCDESCEQVYLGIYSHLGMINYISDGLSWTVLKCIHEDQKVLSAQRFTLKAECNSKLAVALSIIEECFQSMVDSRTGINMLPHVLYNWGSKFARLNFGRFFTLVLERDDVLISVASIRVHGTTVAEMPLIATCSKFRRQGMCRLLLTIIEEMLQSFKVEKLVIAAIPELVETWTKGFGFQPINSDEKRTLKNINLMVFPGTVLLKKSLYHSQIVGGEPGKLDLSSCAL